MAPAAPAYYIRRVGAYRRRGAAVCRLWKPALARRLVRKAHEAVHMTPKEFDLLYYLMSHAGLPITHMKLLQAIWGAEYGRELEYLRTYVHNLRQKLEDDPASPQYLLTEAHVGYRFREPEKSRLADKFSQ